MQGLFILRKAFAFVGVTVLLVTAFAAIDIEPASATPWTCKSGEKYASCGASSGRVVSGRADVLGVFSLSDKVDSMTVCRVNGACYLSQRGWSITVRNVPPGRYYINVVTEDEFGTLSESINSPVVVVNS